MPTQRGPHILETGRQPWRTATKFLGITPGAEWVKGQARGLGPVRRRL